MTYKPEQRVKNKGSKEKATLVQKIEYVDADECDWTVNVDDGDQTSWCERDFDPLDSPEELKEGDRVSHPTLGEGTIVNGGDVATVERGVALVKWDKPLPCEVTDWELLVTPVALSLLTKVEPKEESDDDSRREAVSVTWLRAVRKLLDKMATAAEQPDVFYMRKSLGTNDFELAAKLIAEPTIDSYTNVSVVAKDVRPASEGQP